MQHVIGIGIFDGVHLGHQALVQKVLTLAKQQACTSLIYTFHPHPIRVLNPAKAPLLIEPLERRIERFKEFGIEKIHVETFTKEFAAISAEEFVKSVLVEQWQAKHIVIGETFAFGHKQQGNVALLKNLSSTFNFTTHPVANVEHQGIKVSSSTIRDLVKQGNVAQATTLLGHPFELSGIVVHGDKRGRQLGFPTANLFTENELLPKPGVYAATCKGQFGVKACAVNVGYSPTFANTPFKVEAHVLDFDGDLYDQPFSISFAEYLREELKFSSLEELTKQIHHDVEQVSLKLMRYL